MKELCPRLLEPKKPLTPDAPPEFSVVNACKREKQLGGDGYYDCPDCQVTIVTRRVYR